MTFEAKRLGDVAEIIGGGTPSTKDAGNWDGDIPWLTPKDLSSFEGIYVERGSRSITELGFKNSSAKMLPAGAVLYTSRAPIGYVAIASNPISTNQGFKSLILKDGYVPEFLFYLLKASKSEIESYASGGTFAEISAKALSDVVLQFPPKSQQKAIAKLLVSLDEKIAINRSLSKTLEDISQVIFKSWFIDFAPVKAKMAGEKPVGINAATAALFPDTLEESELGLIPKGWKVSNLESLSFVRYGAPFASKLFNTTKVGLPLIRIRDLKKQLISTWSPENHTKGFLVSGGQLLVGMDGEFNPTIWYGEDALVNQRICKIEPKEFVSNLFLYFTLLPIMRRIEHGSTGSTVIHLGKTDIDAIKICEPSQNILSEFKSKVEPMLQQIVSLNIQARILREARESLLPRLISGELQIPEEMLTP